MNQIIFIFSFTSLFFLILFWGHFLFYLILINSFWIISIKTKLIVWTILFILSVSFITSSSLAHYFENIFTKWIYFISGIWLGFLLYFEIIFGLILLCNYIFKQNLFSILWKSIFFINSPASPVGEGRAIDFNIFSKSNLSTTKSFYLTLALSIFFVAYGICCAFSPAIKNIDIKLKNLPINWQNKNIVLITDVHLGHIYTGDFMDKIVSDINKLNSEAVLIVWDLFDWMDWNLSSLVNPLKNLKSSKWAYYVTGNHETYLGVEKITPLLKNFWIKVLNDEKIDIDWIEIVWLSYPERWAFKDFSKTFSWLNLSKTIPKILLYHSPVHLEEADKAGIDLQLSGHTHKWQMFPFNFITEIVYAGHDYWLTNFWNLQIYTSKGVWTWWPTLRTFNRWEIVNIVLNK